MCQYNRLWYVPVEVSVALLDGVIGEIVHQPERAVIGHHVEVEIRGAAKVERG